MKKLLIIFALFSFAFFCFADDYKPYFENYVALGDSPFAGFQDGGLVDFYQNVSIAKLIGIQGGAGTFALPLISPPGIPPLLTLTVDANGNLGFAQISEVYGTPTNLNYPAPYNNLAVPGATTYNMLNTVTDGGGLHDVILRGLGTQLQQAIALQPKLIILWIGSNDVLAAVVSGRVIEGVTIVPKATFEQNINGIVSILQQNTSAKIVMINIPKVTLVPYANYVDPYISALGQKIYLIGPNGQLTDNDLVLLPAVEYLKVGIGIPAAVGGTGIPLPDEVVLDSTEKATVMNRVNDFNSIVSQVCSTSNIPLLDINSFLEKAAKNGIAVGGVNLTTEFLIGGLFSLDGIHPTTIGNAIIANELIELMNKSFDWEIPLVDLSKYLWTSQRPAGSSSFSNNKARITN